MLRCCCGWSTGICKHEPTCGPLGASFVYTPAWSRFARENGDDVEDAVSDDGLVKVCERERLSGVDAPMMIRGWVLRVLAVSGTVLVLHTAVMPDLRIGGVAAELPIGLVVASGLVGGAERGAIYGFAFGSFVDVFLFTPIGLSALIYGLIGWASGHVFMNSLEETPLLASLIIALGTGLGLLCLMLFGMAIGEVALLGVPIGRIIVVSSLLNMLLGSVFMRLSRWMWTVDYLGRRLDQGSYERADL